MDNLPPVLAERIRTTQVGGRDVAATGKYILYLPTVVLRKQHNAAFALACRLANAKNLPLITLAVVLDDALYMDKTPAQEQIADALGGSSPVIAFTARRVAFVLEALQAAAQEWSDHGSGVLVRVHGNNARHAHHLTLARNANAIVTDEPFVQPYVNYVRAAERAAAGTVYRVDSSTTVPPAAILRQAQPTEDCDFRGVPAKAYLWENMTSSKRKNHVIGATKHGYLDAPTLEVPLTTDFLFADNNVEILSLPLDWRARDTSCPDKRPWTADELSRITPKEWVLQWDGIDATVLPCQQTHGSKQAGDERWRSFLDERISGYAKKRNDVTQPHAVSRMSCYLNYGVVSIFNIVSDLWKTKAPTKKFEDEIVKWREIGYAHAIANPKTYNRAGSVPTWARNYLQNCVSEKRNARTAISLQNLADATTDEPKWNAMQSYLIRTGELHNNARMTWGKSIVHWKKYEHNVDLLLAEMVYLNDRLALDGLSPPSYAGLLWCLGWCDKAGTVLTEKPSARYRASPEAFEAAKNSLLAKPVPSSHKRKRSVGPDTKPSRSLTDFFSAVG